MDVLKKQYPFIEVFSIGQSVMGKEILAIRIGGGHQFIHYNGSCHANEWMTSVLLMKFIEDYSLAYSKGKRFRGINVKKLYQDTTLFIVPMINPDGVELVLNGISFRHPYFEQLLIWNRGSYDFSQWKSNIRGVDLNDQFPANWELEKQRRSPTGPSPQNFVGGSPLCEPEAKALEGFTRKYDFQWVISFHTQGEEIYWNYRDHEPPESKKMAIRLGEVSGYKPVKLEGSDAGYKDWFIQEFRRPGFTVEAGLGKNPLKIEGFDSLYDKAVMIMLEGLRF